MQETTSYGIEFAPNRSRKNLLLFYVIIGLFICVGLGMLIGALLGESGLLSGGLIMTAFALLMLFATHFLTAPLKVSYTVGKNSLVLKQGKMTLEIPYSEVESLTHLKEKQGEEFILQLQNKMVEKQRQQLGGMSDGNKDTLPTGFFGGMANAFNEQKKAFEKYKYLSVAIGFSSSGNQRGPKKASGADLPCDTIFILQKNGEGYLISPLYIEGFMREVKIRMGS